MHRTIDISVASDRANALVTELKSIEGVVGLRHHPGASILPVGDRVTIHVLNRAADKVLLLFSDQGRYGSVSIVTSEVASITDPERQEAVDNDVDEAIWEEMETGLRHQGHVTQNYLALMAAGGVISGAGLLAIHEPAVQIIAAVAAAVVAPGFDPVAKLPLGMILKRWEVAKSGILSTFAGYTTLIVAACTSYAILATLGAVPTGEEFAASSEVKRIADPSWPDLLISACGAFAGVVIQAAFRQAVIAGALIALTIIDAAALIGVGAAIGEIDLAYQGFERLAIDVAMIVVAGLLVFGAKQMAVHRRTPLR